MVELLRKKTRKSYIIRAVLTLAGAIALLFFTKFAIISVVTGAKELDITKDPAAYEGQYVTLDVDFFVTDYVEHTTTTTRRYGGSSTTVNGNSYVAFQAVNDYESGMSTWYFYSVYMKKGDERLMERKMNEAWDWLGDETGTTAPPEPMEVTGTWTAMEPQIERYFRETLAELGISEGEYDRFYFYSLDTGKIGGQNTFAFWAMNAAALVLLILFVLSVAGIFGNGYLGNIKKYLLRDTSVSMTDIENDFAQAHEVGGDTWIGSRFTVYRRGTKAYILKNEDLVWGYYFRRTGRNSVSEMRLYKKDKSIAHLSMSEAETKQSLQYYAAEQPQIIVGYSSDLEKTWQKDFDKFLEIRYNPAMRGETTGR